MDKENNEIKMPLKESLFLSPIEKYKLYGRFPWKMVIHIALVITTTTQVHSNNYNKAILILSNITSYSRAQERLLYSMFIEDTDKTDLDYKRFTYLFSVKDLKNHVNSSINAYYNLGYDSLQNISYPDNLSTLNIDMEVNYLQNNITSYKKKGIKTNISYENLYKINKTNLGPFMETDENLKLYINDVIDFKIIYKFSTEIPIYKYNKFECFKWVDFS